MEFQLDLPGFNYFVEGNVWTGSCTKSRKEPLMLRVRIAPDRENEKLLVWLWKNEDVCFERAKDFTTRELPFLEASLDAIKSWLSEEYREL